MMSWDIVVRQHEHCADLLRKAELDRLVRQARAGMDAHRHFYCRALVWLGRELVAWGQGLQQKHGAAAAATMLRSAAAAR
jgi:hypothetical protein